MATINAFRYTLGQVWGIYNQIWGTLSYFMDILCKIGGNLAWVGIGIVIFKFRVLSTFGPDLGSIDSIFIILYVLIWVHYVSIMT